MPIRAARAEGAGRLCLRRPTGRELRPAAGFVVGGLGGMNAGAIPGSAGGIPSLVPGVRKAMAIVDQRRLAFAVERW